MFSGGKSTIDREGFELGGKLAILAENFYDATLGQTGTDEDKVYDVGRDLKQLATNYKLASSQISQLFNEILAGVAERNGEYHLFSFFNATSEILKNEMSGPELIHARNIFMLNNDAEKLYPRWTYERTDGFSLWSSTCLFSCVSDKEEKVLEELNKVKNFNAGDIFLSNQ